MRTLMLALFLGAAGLPAQAQSPSPAPAAPNAPAEPSTGDKARAMIDKAIAYLRSQQHTSGGWEISEKGPNFPAITALVLRGMIENATLPESDPTVAKGAAYMLSLRQPDGGIYDKVLPNYNTAICLATVAKLTSPEARAAVKPAQDFLKTLQFGEDAREYPGMSESAKIVPKDHPFYGGVGYGRHGRPDLSNTAWYLEALHDSGVDSNDPAFQRALVFLQRLQMDQTVNPAEHAKGSSQGGFIYATSVNRDRVGDAQTYAGEIAESLSGPPGTVAVIRLVGPDGNPKPMTRVEAAERLTKTFAEAPEAKQITDRGFMVVLGPSSDGLASARLEIRTALTNPETLDRLIIRAFSADLDKTRPVEYSIVNAWKGVSRLRAYGSMSYAGFKSYIYAGLSKNDPRVAAALRWVAENYTLEENPGMGNEGLYYYYVTFARAMAANGSPTVAVKTADGTADRQWAKDLVDRLAKLQQPDGSFAVQDSRWMEDRPVLLTAYALIALQEAAKVKSK